MPVPRLDAEIAALLATVPVRLQPLSADTLPGMREMLGATPVSLSDAVERTDVEVPGPPGAPGVTVRVHRPKDLGGVAPCVFSIHGGGYILGHRSMDDLRMDQWCPELGFIGVSVEYRLAPETPYPGPLEDCYAALAWTFAHAGDLGIDANRIGIAGASAGGGLAAALALLCRQRGEIQPAFQLLAYPMLDDRQATRTSRWDAVPIWTPSDNAFGWRSYLGGLYGTEDVPATAAPARAMDFAGLPPALVFVGTLDGFCDEDTAYARELWGAGVDTELHVYPGAPHGFDSIGPGTAISKRCVADQKEWLARMLRGS